jgi:hypothetical protein
MFQTQKKRTHEWINLRVESKPEAPALTNSPT